MTKDTKRILIAQVDCLIYMNDRDGIVTYSKDLIPSLAAQYGHSQGHIVRLLKGEFRVTKGIDGKGKEWVYRLK